MEDQITNFGSHLGGERRHDVVEFSFLYCDASCGKLGIHLGEPSLRVSGPKCRDFEIDCGHRCPAVFNCQCLPKRRDFRASVFFMHGRLSGSPMLSITLVGRYFTQLKTIVIHSYHLHVTI